MLIIVSTATTSSLWIFHSANGQPSITNKRPLPVILIHGYFEPKSVWDHWQNLLESKTKTFAVTFNTTDDKCGSADEHAKELGQVIKEVKRETGQDKVNIVGHSKGGLDARVYLANNHTSKDVANLIMIGTPNAGSPLADFVVGNSLPYIQSIYGKIFASYWLCTPALLDLQTNANATLATRNNNTNYYTIAGNWIPNAFIPNCSAQAIDFLGSTFLAAPSDGIVPLWSVESTNQTYFHNLLPHSTHCHQDLLGDQEFGLAEPILLSKQ